MIAIEVAIVLPFLLVLPTLLYFRYAKPGPTTLPPGPRPLPVIGNFHLLGQFPHRALAKLAQKYGPIMSIRLAQVPSIVISSPHAAELVLKQHDLDLSGRPKIQAWLYGPKAMAFTPYGDYWRRVRMICAQHLLGAAYMAEFEGMRTEETEAAMQKLAVAAAAREVVDVDKVVGELVEDMAMIMIVGNKGMINKGDERLNLKEVIGESLSLAGEFNLGDYIPCLRPFDLQGINKKVKRLRKKADEIFDHIIEDHLKEENTGKHKDILGTMLNLTTKDNELSSSFTNENVKGIMFELFGGGIDTTLSTITWALAALMKKPQTMKKLQQELQDVIGINQLIRESDLSKLSYLDMVVKETARLYPVAPFLIPHESTKDVIIEGYSVPQGSRIMVNTWAIGHDPNVWSENVEEFYPERFVNNSIDLRGHHFELLPFGAGRRSCPGLQLGLTNFKLILAKLVHYFDWELPNGMEPQKLDMTEKFGLAMPRVMHLFAIPSKRSQPPPL